MSQVQTSLNRGWNPETHRNVLFNGTYINTTAIARHLSIDQSYLWRVLTGKRQPTIDYAQRIARFLGMSLEDFLEAISTHKSLAS